MEAKCAEIPTVALNPFRFTDWLKAPDGTTNDTSNDIPSQPYWGPQPPLDFRRPEAYERMAADKPGEELAHDATVWKLYLEEAEEHDQELVKSRHGSLDMLLLFAALFSAILTAFLIESKDLLQQDPTDASAALLLMVVQSQQRIELGLPSPVDTPISDLPAFVPSPSARWINGIWFTSLALSLSAALLAMLGKEWLTAYLASRPRPPRQHALLRQARLEGLERWWALHIIALLPSLLHTSLFLFSIGLVIYLWTLDAVVAGIIAGVIGITSLFYVVTAILGAVYEHCPFVTQVSGYIKRAFASYFRSQPSEQDGSSVTSVQDLQALLWLANNARDPAVVDCSYHALAGLHHQTDPTLLSNSSKTSLDSNPALQKPSRLPMQINSDTTMLSLFHTLAERLRKVATSPQLSSSTGGTNLERYATALVWLFKYVKDFKLNEQSNDQERSVSNRLGFRDHPSTVVSAQTKAPSADYVLGLLDDIWSNSRLSFSANTYARLLNTQMTLLNLAVSLESRDNNTPRRPPVGTPFSISCGLDTITKNAHVVDIIIANSDSPYLQRLADLRASYSRTLCRISFLLRLYSEQKIQIEVTTLISLFGALRTAADCEDLNPQDSISTHHVQRNSVAPSSFCIGVSAGANAIRCDFSVDDLYEGPLGRLVDILRMKSGIADAVLLLTRTAAVEAFSALAPVLLQQVLQLDRAELREEFDFRNWSELPALDMPRVRYVASRQMLLVLRHLGPKLGFSDTHPKLVSSALDLTNVFATEEDSYERFGARLALERYGEDLVPLMEFANVSNSNLGMFDRSASFDLISLSRAQLLTLCETGLSPICFPILIQMIAPAAIATPVVEHMLQSMLKRIRNGPISPGPNISYNDTPSIDYLDCFTHTNKGFSSLSTAATVDEHLEVVADAIAEFIGLAANRHLVLEGASVELRTLAVPGFLDVVSVVAKFCSRNPERQQMLLDFSRDVVKLIEVAVKDPESQELVSKHEACNNLCSALESVGEQVAAHEVLAQVKRLRCILGIGDTVQKDSTVELNVNTLSEVNVSNNEGVGNPGDSGAVPSTNEEGNIA